MSGSGNDFIVIDNRSNHLDALDKSLLARALCRRRISVGADGLILLEEPSTNGADVKMNYYNSDGSPAAMCGNGARCTAFAFSSMTGTNNIIIETGAGNVGAEVMGDMVKVQMPRGRIIERNVELSVDGLPMLFDHIDTGVPHAVAIVDDVDSVPVKYWGREVRHHRLFMPEGTNVDFVEVIDGETLRIRTYERGVEDETLSCGTGAVAAAISANRRELVSQRVKVITGLPDRLIVEIERDEKNNEYITTITGRVILSFRGETDVEFNPTGAATR